MLVCQDLLTRDADGGIYRQYFDTLGEAKAFDCTKLSGVRQAPRGFRPAQSFGAARAPPVTTSLHCAQKAEAPPKR